MFGWRRHAPARTADGDDSHWIDAALTGTRTPAATVLEAVEEPLDTRPRALVVEDFQDLADLEAHVLRRLGYVVTTVPGVDEALDHINDDRLAMVILDLRLGSADGLNLLSHIRRIRGAWPPVLVVSGMIGADVFAYLGTVENVATLSKVDIGRLADAVRALRTSARTPVAP